KDWHPELAADAHVLAGRHTLRLATLRRPDGKFLQPGDEVRYRLKATDNRRVADLGPNVAYYPAAGWRTVRIARHAEPLQQAEILAQKNDLRPRLEAIKRDLERQQRAASRVRRE